jgi:predicted enzyme related to lactoylglutathione lyase
MRGPFLGHHIGRRIAMAKLCHFEIPSRDYEKSKEFYESLFGWKIDIQPEMNYGMIHIKDGIGGGLTNEFKPATEPGLALYFEVDDIPGTLMKAVDLGGAEVKPKTPIGGGEMGYYAEFKDLDGNIIGLWSRA